MAKYRTAQGKVIDMSQLASRNETTRAVGNMSVNARGDTIDGTGKVILPVTKKVGEKYQRTVSNRAANLVKRKTVESKAELEATAIIEPKEDVIDFVEEELEFLDTTEEDDVIEKIKAVEAAKELERKLAQDSKKIKIKPASEAPDSFDPNA
jgi:hypothetical protein